ncbi:MAG: hypothetical protein ABI228_06990 [Burkholderiaceae bacterium]
MRQSGMPHPVVSGKNHGNIRPTIYTEPSVSAALATPPKDVMIEPAAYTSAKKRDPDQGSRMDRQRCHLIRGQHGM